MLADNLEGPPPWDRLKGEPALWFDRFDRYRQLGARRTIEAVYKQEYPKGRPSQTWYRRAKGYNWQERAEAWDDFKRRERIAQELAEQTEMLRRHRQAGQSLQTIALLKLNLLNASPAELTPADARTYLKDGIEIERLGFGLPTELAGFLQMTDDQLLQKYRNLLERVTNDRGGLEAQGLDPSADSDAE